MLKVDINLLWTVINILVICLIVKLFLLKPVHKILDERQKMIEGNIAAAEASKKEAAELAEEQKAFFAQLDEEKAKAMKESTDRASEVYDQIVGNANDQAKTILKNAEREAERQKKAALREAESEIRELVISATAKVIGTQTGDDSALYDQFLDKVGGSDDKNNE